MVHGIMFVVAVIVCFLWIIKEPGYPPLLALSTLLLAKFSKAYHAVIGLRILSVARPSKPIRNLRHYRYSFAHTEYINPMIVADLEGWLSDIGDQVVAVNISDSNKSNRYSASVSAAAVLGKAPIVSATSGSGDDVRLRYSYQWLGCSINGIHVLQTSSWGGGSGIFCGIILVVLAEEPTIDVGRHKTNKSERLVIKKIAYLSLGDRYQGRVTYRFGCLLTIGACTGRATRYEKTRRLIVW